ncbi:MAG: bifunctional 5,10-methylenetetrahydrofolate dehydrogenase/5,10-methenyltetrahydrofolate cyclohydrolase [Planctomycetota bacterium]|jgi:methylenetetrahydrofolate dehydrogenase (NADP+)/methenyltetrahydrofolate cyclohydrolase
MPAKLIDGGAVAAGIRENLAKEIETLKGAGVTPRLAAVQANDNPGSRIYVKNQRKSCEEVGLAYDLVELPVDASQEDMEAKINELGADPAVTGIILQMPVPKGVDQRALQRRIPYAKDVEGLHPHNLGTVVYGDMTMSPCTAKGAFLLAKGLDMPPSRDPLPGFAQKMIEEGKTTASLYGKNVTIVGHSEIVGKPLALLFLDAFCTVTVCHVGTPPERLREACLRADILCTATGVPQVRWGAYRKALKALDADPANSTKPILPDFYLVHGDMIRAGSAVIDIAINRIPKAFDGDGKPVLNEKGKTSMRTVGDVDYDEAVEAAGWLTKLPGGVGPMTVAMLLENTVAAAKAQTG